MKLSKIFLLLVAAGMAVISSDAQERGRESNTRARGYLGASVESSSKPKGIRIQQVYANTAAARAKLNKGDIILKMNGSAVTSNSALIGRLSKTKPGQKATLLVSSGGKTKTVQVQLGRSYSTRSPAQSGSTKSRSSSSPSRSSQSKSSPSRGSSRSRTPQRSSGDDWRKAIEERMKKAREDREKAENNFRGRGNERSDRSDRGEDMRKAWEERMKQWQRERGNNDNRRGPQRGSQGQNWHGPRGR
jgi:membrane-associated protease RseP (regulator of RpoE activity)